MQNEIQITSSPAVKSRLVEETHKRTAPNIKLVNFWTCCLLLLLLGTCQVVWLSDLQDDEWREESPSPDLGQEASFLSTVVAHISLIKTLQSNPLSILVVRRFD